jgi:hypothetical protein
VHLVSRAPSSSFDANIDNHGIHVLAALHIFSRNQASRNQECNILPDSRRSFCIFKLALVERVADVQFTTTAFVEIALFESIFETNDSGRVIGDGVGKQSVVETRRGRREVGERENVRRVGSSGLEAFEGRCAGKYELGADAVVGVYRLL